MHAAKKYQVSQAISVTAKPRFIVLVGSPEKSDGYGKTKYTGGPTQNMIGPGTTDIERWIRENDICGNDIYIHLTVLIRN
jgi:hypothetical protein